MADLSTKYLGLNLRNPLIVGSCGLTNSMEDLREIEKYGAGAVILKSLFEEEIEIEMKKNMASMTSSSNIYPEIFDMFDIDSVEDTLSKYLNLIAEANKELSIPVIPSINCVSASEWTYFAKKMQEAGAPALELNVFLMPSDFNKSADENEKIYFDIINKVKQEVTIPVSLKVSYYFTNLSSVLLKLSESGIDGLVLFNKFFAPDFDINNFRIIPSNLYTSPSDISISLRWVAIMAERVKCDLAASTGVHSGKAAIKQLLAGANAVQFASVLYKNGISYIQTMIDEMNEWMEEMGYEKIDEFRGKMSQANSINPAVFERAQFMKHFSQKF
jgi:dihydroorotate dehydrogenase (fumarate)